MFRSRASAPLAAQTLKLGGAAPVALAALNEAYESWLPDYMSHPQGANP